MKDKSKINYKLFSNHIGLIYNLRKEIENKDEIIRKLSATLNSITNNLGRDPTVVLNNNNLLLVTTPSNSNENIPPSAVLCNRELKIKRTVQAFLQASPKLINR